ncbi:hypothetical protein L2E82_06073 [Cichorium intybus]|uniref:Uncharacterized protein n=1 Tax=Cichorium intybus TaxID=13427 RepID=A0ACB9HAJ3_CICIN|nr:hypothetical protein L2E82_06073 [Cichorium intybus]
MDPSDQHRQKVESFGKLPQLQEENDSGNKFKATRRLLFSTEYPKVAQAPLKDFHNLDSLFLDTTPPFRYQLQELTDIESQYSELIKPQTSSHVAVRQEVGDRKLSTDAIIRLGGERFIQSCSSSINGISMSSHPYGGSLSGFSDQEAKDVELIENLLLSAEKVTHQQFERSSNLLDWCDVLSSNSGNPIQRLVHYFSKALREKIAIETGRIPSHGLGKKYVEEIEGKMMTPNPTTLSVYQNLPFFQAGQFPMVQAIVDAVGGAAKVHIIDLSIKQGVQCTILMQALASQPNFPIEHVKLTAVGTKFKEKLEEMGDRLRSFAESINLSFSYNVAMVDDMLDFKEELLELDPEEALAVYSSYALWGMIGQQDRLESLMKVIKNINPHVMVVSEVAANLNSPNFVNRFIEALFFHGAFFDALEDCMDREDENRAITESLYMGRGIRNIVAAEGPQRVVRHVNIDVWRKFFSRFGMKETELSMSSLYQANLMAEKFACGRSCTFDLDGNCLIIGWKGIPIQCLSVWKFS